MKSKSRQKTDRQDPVVKASQNAQPGEYESFIDSLFEGVVSYDENGKIVVCNLAASRILGISREEVLARTSVDPRWVTVRKDGSPFPAHQHPSMHTLRTGEPCRNVIMGIQKPDGSLSWVNINSQPVFKPDSNLPYSVTCSFVDISDQHHLMEKLKNSERIQRLVLSSTSTAFILMDRQLCARMINEAAVKLIQFNYGKKLLVGDYVPGHITEDRRDVVVEYLNRSLEGEEVAYEISNKYSGKLLFFSVRFRPLWDEEKKVIGVYAAVRDITQEKEADRLLRDSEKRFRVLFNSAYKFMTMVSCQGVVLEANQAFLNFTGLKMDEIVGREVWQTGIWTNSDAAGSKLQKAITVATNGKFVRYELKIIGSNGIGSEIDFSLNPIRDDNGKVTMLIAAGRVLDEKRRMERQLREKELQFVAFMKNTPTVNWIVDEHSIIRYINPLGLQKYGFEESIVGKSLCEILPGDICREYEANNLRVFSRNEAIETHERAIGPDGEMRIQHVFKFPLGSDANGVRLLGRVGMDITSLVSIQQALENSNELYEYARKATSDAIWDWDILQNKIILSEVFARKFGRSSLISNIDTRTAHVHPKDRDRYKKSIRHALSGASEFWQLEYRIRTHPRKYRIVLDKAYIIRDEQKKPIRMIGAMQDVTSHRNLEKKLIQEVEKRKRAIIKAIIDAQEKEKKEISDELHDNVNQILATCNLYLDVLIKKTRDPALLKECKGFLKTAMEELRNISHNLTPAAFKEKGLFPTIREMMEKINVLGTLAINLNFIETEVLEEQLLPEMKTAIYRIIQEQIKNVLKHSQASRAKIMVQYGKEKISLQIQDNGKGFDVNAVKRGLGLNNIQSRISLFEGEMTIRSSPGKGCAIKAVFPFKPRYPV